MEEKVNLVRDVNGNNIYLGKLLGQGGQGAVYRSLDKNIAVKFLVKNGKIDTDIEDYKKFEEKVNDVAIMRVDDDIHLCKPEVMLEKPTCGYVMKLLDGLESLNSLIYTDNDGSLKEFYKQTGGLKKRFEVLLELARVLVRLHSKGIVYCDISPNNVFFAPGDLFSKVWLIDCDNLKFSSETKKGIYTPNYGAPEVVAKASDNTVFSDVYSFAILAFKVLTNLLPFQEGFSGDSESSEGWDASTTSDSYLEKDLPFIVESNNKDLLEALKPYLTNDLMNLFKRTFSQSGKLNPTSRPTMRAWYEELKRSLTRIGKCSCGNYVYASFNTCPFCNKEISKNQFVIIDDFHSKAEENYKIVKTEIEAMDIDDDFTLTKADDELIIKAIKKMNRISSLIFDGYKIYSFNIDDETIMDNPYVILEFNLVNNNLIVKNVSDKKVYIDCDGKFKEMPYSIRLEKGDTQYFLMLNSFGVKKIVYLSFK